MRGVSTNVSLNSTYFFPSSHNWWLLISTKEVFCLVPVVSCSEEGSSKVPARSPSLKEWGADFLLCYHKALHIIYQESMIEKKSTGLSHFGSYSVFKIGQLLKILHFTWAKLWMVLSDRERGSIALQFPSLLLNTHPRLPHFLDLASCYSRLRSCLWFKTWSQVL